MGISSPAPILYAERNLLHKMEHQKVWAAYSSEMSFRKWLSVLPTLRWICNEGIRTLRCEFASKLTSNTHQKDTIPLDSSFMYNLGLIREMSFRKWLSALRLSGLPFTRIKTNT